MIFLQILNSVVMNHVSIEDGCTVQGAVICSNVLLQEGCVLRDCQVSPEISNNLEEIFLFRFVQLFSRVIIR